MKPVFRRFVPMLLVVSFALIMLAACGGDAQPRLVTMPTYNPGPAFQTNFNDIDPRRQIKCSLIFEVYDEQAIEELTERNYKVRNSVLIVLSELTLEEITTGRDLDNIAERIVEKVNEDLNATGGISLVLRAYFSEFAIV